MSFQAACSSLIVGELVTRSRLVSFVIHWATSIKYRILSSSIKCVSWLYSAVALPKLEHGFTKVLEHFHDSKCANPIVVERRAKLGRKAGVTESPLEHVIHEAAAPPANIHVRMYKYVEDILPRRAQMLCRTVLLIALNVVSEFWISGALTRTLRRFYTCQATSAVYQRFKPTFILCAIFYPIS